MPTIVEIIDAAEVLENLVSEKAYYEVSPDGDTAFGETARQLRDLAVKRNKPPWRPTVRVDDSSSAETVVYIEKPDGDQIGVYVGDCYTPNGYTVSTDLGPTIGSGGVVYDSEVPND